MKREPEIKYQNSVNLFHFCRRVLDHKFGGVRVIDQDVGQILGFDPADCSHWKKGKKNVRSIHAMKSIAQHLGVDERLIIEIAMGDLTDNEAFIEYSGYGEIEIDPKVVENAKKEYYRKNAATWTRDKETEFKNLFDINADAIAQVVAQIHERINFKEAPLYLPEIVTSYPNIELIPVEKSDQFEGSMFPCRLDLVGEKVRIHYLTGTEIRPYMRYRVAKFMATAFLNGETFQKSAEIADQSKHLWDIQSNVFASQLLTPASLVRQELKNVNVARDIVTQLAEVFWVSKSFMNRRLREIMHEKI